MKRRIKDFQQRDISYGELVALQQEFETQLDENGVIFDDDESYDEALYDFIQQYMEGDDNPMIDLSTANVRPVRDSKRRRVRDGRREIDAWRKDFDNFENDYADYKQKVMALVPTLSPDEVDGRYSDLYLKSTPKVDEFINSLRGSYRLGGSRVSRFKSNIDGTPWYEIVFGNLWWDSREYKSETDFSQICKGGSISDSRRPDRNMRRRVKDDRREDLSWGELAELSGKFESQMDERGIELEDDEYLDMFMEFVDMYARGEEPDVDVLY